MIDNPGGSSNYTYHAKFKGQKNIDSYLYHEMPTGAQPVPADAERKRTAGGFDFHYNGWQAEDDNPDFCRHGASRRNMKPDCRQLQLDG